MFKQDQISHFRKEGFLAVNDFFNEKEVTALRAAFQELLDKGILHNVATDHDGKSHSQKKLNLQVCPLSYHHPLFAALPFHAKVREALSDLLGQESIFKLLDQIFYKPARNGAGTNWHQDNHYFQMSDPFAGTAMWVALHDATIANGTLRVIPSNWDKMLEHKRDPDSDHHFRCYVDESKAVPVELRAGGVLCFCFQTPHATGGNATDAGRAGLAYHFMKLKHETERPEMYEIIQEGRTLYGKPGHIHGPILTGERYSQGQKEYGQDMTQVLSQEINRLS